MTELELVKQLFQLPLTVILALVVVFLWRKLEKLQEKYENVLVDMGTLRGKVDAEIQIDQKLEKIFRVLEQNQK